MEHMCMCQLYTFLGFLFSLTEGIYFLESLNPAPKQMKMITQATHVEIYLVTKFETRKQFFNIFLSLFHLSISSRNWQTGSFLFSFQQTCRRVESARISKIFLLRMQKFGKYYGRISRLLHFLTTCNISSFLARDWVCLLFNGLFFFFVWHHSWVCKVFTWQARQDKSGLSFKITCRDYVSSTEKHVYIGDEHKFWDLL